VYPKNQEILLSIFASIYPYYTDTGRIIKLILMGVAAVAVYNFTQHTYPLLRKYGIVFILFGIFLHPLVLAQVFTKYVDDMLYMFAILYVISFLSREYRIALLLFALFVGSKLNYVIYIVASLPLLIYTAAILRGVSWRDIVHEIWRMMSARKALLGLTFLIGVIISAYPYIINIINYGNPVYPLL
jgi:hypothetical protein